MKREATTHTKMVRLERRLDLRHYEAVGLLELLWHLTAKEAPAGNIGKLTDEDIALSLGWEFDPQALIEALVDAGWLDSHEEYRLIVHDWREHCEDSVHVKLARARTLFADGTPPVFHKANQKQREIYERELQEGKFLVPGGKRRAQAEKGARLRAPNARLDNEGEQYHALPNQTKPNQAIPFPHAEKNDETPPSMPDPFVEFQRMFKGEFPDDTWRAFMSHVNTPERLVLFQKHTPLWMKTKKYQDGFGKDAKWYIKSGIWKKAPDQSLFPSARSPTISSEPAPNMYPDGDEWMKAVDFEQLERERREGDRGKNITGKRPG